MKRSSGILMHVSSLWGDYSAGSFGTPAKEWVDFLAACGFGVWQVLPFCLPDECHSPYKSYGAFSLNPDLIDLTTLYRQGLITRAELEDARQRTPYMCDFERLSGERLVLLGKAAERAGYIAEMNDFLRAHPQTDRFCHFMACRAANGNKPWTDWETDAGDESVLRTWRFTQFECYRQWMEIRRYANERGVRMIGDLPIYVAHDSADVWANRELFQLDRKNTPVSVAGVPPDYFSADGQLWGNPLYRWNVMRRDGYSWWKERMRFTMELFDGVRIDHFRGLESYFSIPAGETTARNGVWKKGPGMHLLRALSPIAEGKTVIAEDLGDITPEVRALVEKSGFPGMRVLQFGFLGDRNSPHLPHNYPENCVAYTGTHDNNTLLGYVWELEPSARAALLRYIGFEGEDWDQCYPAILRTMLASHAGLVIFPVQDLLFYGSDTRLNTPGKSTGNWSYRVTKEQIAGIDRSRLREWNRMYGRSDI